MKKLLSLLIIGCSVSLQAELKPYYLDAPQASSEAHRSDAQKEYFAIIADAMKQVEQGANMSDFFVIETAANPADSVSPLLGAIMFDQGTPYNNDCPIINTERAVTGCVATAMAEVMAYYRYPACGTGVVEYTGGSQGKTSLDLSKHPFDWNNMLPTYSYSGGYTTAQAKAVSNLMLCCGAALNMQYSADGSSSNTAKVAGIMKTNFAYATSCEGYTSVGDPNPSALIEEDWCPTMREEFQKKHPVIYSGAPSSKASGHCFVIDGYKVIDDVYYYHVNWGWNGSENGYFLINNLQTSQGKFSGYGCQMVVGIVPPGWTDVENVNVSSTQDACIYTILGTRVREDEMQHGCIYVRGGKKFLYY